MDSNKDRMGTSFERQMADMFARIGFKTKLNTFITKKDGRRSEQDVLAENGGLTILIQCKDYSKFPDIKVKETIEDLIEDGEALGVDRLVLAIIGLKDTSSWFSYAKEHGVFLWNENYWRELQKIETNQELKHEIGKKLSLPEFFVSSVKINRLIDSARISQEERERLHEEAGSFGSLTELEEEIKLLELTEKIRNDKEDIELEEVFNLVKDSNLDFNKRYLILKKLDELNLSEDSARVIGFEKIKTYLEKMSHDSGNESEGANRFVELENLYTRGSISLADKRRIQQEISLTLGVNGKGLSESSKISVDREIRSAVIKRKIYKTLIFVLVWLIIVVILWRIFF